MKNTNKNICHSKLDLESHRFLKRQQGEILKQVQDDGLICYNSNSGFTLIELLVVVLIIGILAAVALPQYQKVVERSKATQALTLLKAVAQAQTEYFLANGSYTRHFDDLSIDIPLTGNTKVIAAAQDTKSDGNWSLQLEDATAGGHNFNVYMLRTNGKYQGAGFQILLQSPSGANLNPQIRCLERKIGANITFDSSLPAGAYCEKIIHAPTLTGEGTYERVYSL
ncbi:type IV pilin protein [Candidatus Avelusimicrobium caledoniensis]|uniref:type IV pilin protein n=1 Tax=Candidatus Avelusimicrobium caledoniensis TaxID=3416220 RepID=UPI003D0D8A34